MTLEERLAQIQILDVRTGVTTPVSPQYLAEYLNDPDALANVRMRAEAELNSMWQKGQRSEVGGVDEANFRTTLQSLFQVFTDIETSRLMRESKEADRQEINRRATKAISSAREAVRPALFRLGMVDLSEFLGSEPQVIETQDNYDIRRVGTVRTDTDSVFKGKNSRMDLRVELDFPNRESLQLLRRMIAQCKVAPVLPLESDLLTDVLLNKYASQEQLEDVLQAFLKSEQSENLRGELERHSEETLETFEGLKGALEIGEDFTLYATVKARLDAAKKRSAGPDTKLETDPTHISALAHYGLRYGVALTNFSLSTIKESNHAVRVTLTLTRVYDAAYTKDGLSFMDEVGNPTSDPMRCVHLERYFTRTFLQGETPGPDVFLTRNEEALQRNFLRDPADFAEDEVYNCPLEFSYQAAVALDRKLQHLDLRSMDAVIQGVQLNWKNKLAFHPIQGQQDPAVQHMGVSNMAVKMQIATTDRDVVWKLHRMKDEMEEQMRREEAVDRDARLYLRNGLVNLCGGYSFVISSMTTQTDPKSDDLVYITITFVESKYRPKERETAALLKEQVSVEHVKAFWEALYEPLHSALEKLHPVLKPNPNFQGKFLAEIGGVQLSKIEELALGIVFGWSATEDGRLQIKENIPLMLNTSEVLQSGELAPFMPKVNGVLSTKVFMATLARWVGEKGKGRDGAGAGMQPGLLGNPEKPRISRFYDSSFLPWMRRFDGDHSAKRFFQARIVKSRSLGINFAEPYDIEGYAALKGLFYSQPHPHRDGSGLSLGGSPIRLAATDRAMSSPGERHNFNWIGKDVRAQVLMRFLHMRQALQASAQHTIEKGGDPFDGDKDTFFSINSKIPIGPGDADKDTNAVEHFYRVLLLPVGKPRINRQFWKMLGDTIAHRHADRNQNGRQAWLTRDLDRSFIAMKSAIQVGISDHFGFDQRKFRDRRKHVALTKDTRTGPFPFSNYPDLYLPSYGSMFADEEGQLLTYLDPDPGPVGEFLPLTGAVRDVWRLFAPSWGDLGVEPPFHVRIAFKSQREASRELARTIEDPIEPSFFYSRHSWKDEVTADMKAFRRSYEELQQETRSHYIYLQANPPGGKQGMAELIEKLRRAKEGEVGASGQRQYPYEIQDPDQAAELLRLVDDNKIPSVTFVDAEGQPIWVRTGKGKKGGFSLTTFKGGPRLIRQPFTGVSMPFDAGSDVGVIEQAFNAMPDNHLSFARAYPAYKVYFIEEDREQLLFVDDFYGVNCVSSIEVRHSKKDASLAILRVSNTSGTFENDTFLTKEEMDSLDVGPDDEGEPYFKSFRFRTGTSIQIRMGYSSIAEDLPIVFTGKLVEVKMGPVVQLVCQGHRAELLNEIEYARTTTNPLQILDECFKKLSPPHLGRSMKLGDNSKETIARRLGEDTFFRRDVHWWESWLRLDVNNYLRNVYIHSNAPREVSFLAAASRMDLGDMGQDMLEGLGRLAVLNWIVPDSAYDNWIIPLQPFYDAVQEVVRHMPGHIGYVVPFEADASLFIGTPTQPYYAFSPPLEQSVSFSDVSGMVRRKALEEGASRRLRQFLLSTRYADGKSFDQIGRNQPTLYQWEQKDSFPGDFVTAYHAALFSYEDGDYQWLQGVDPFDLGATWNNSDYQLKRHNVFVYDFSDDWDYLEKNDSDLLRYAVAHVMLLDPERVPWPGAWEGLWKDMFRGLMLPLLDGEYDVTTHGITWLSRFADGDDSPNSPLNDEKAFHEILLKKPHVFAVGSREGATTERFIEKVRELELAGRIGSRIAQTLIDEWTRENNAAESLEGLDKDVTEAEKVALGELSSEIQKLDLRTVDEGPMHVRLRSARLRLFIHYLRTWYEELPSNSQDKRVGRSQRVQESLKDTRAFMLPPGWKPFRDYHMVSSRTDIIANEITASMQQMSNTVAVRRPRNKIQFMNEKTLSIDPTDNIENSPTNEEIVAFNYAQEWSTYPEEEGIPLHGRIGREFRKLLIKVENNAVSDDQAARCALSNLAEAVRPMYRGQLTLTGRHMKPHDVIMLYDQHNDMLGPVEVDEVVHHFSADTGWVTTVTPCTLAMAQDAPGRLQYTGMARYLSNTVDFFNEYWIAIEVGLWALSVFTGGASGALAIAGRGLRTLGTKAGAAILKRGTFALAKGAERSTARRLIAKAMMETLRSRQGAVTRQALAQTIATSPHAMLFRAGRWTLTSGANGFRGVNRLMGPGSYALQPLLGASSFLRMQIGQFQAPVDISLLMLKGRPYTAGLEYYLSDVYSWSDQFRGWWGQLWGAFNSFEDHEIFDEVVGEWQGAER